MPYIYNQNRIEPKFIHKAICTKHKTKACREPSCVDRIAERLAERAIRAEVNFHRAWLGRGNDAASF